MHCPRIISKLLLHHSYPSAKKGLNGYELFEEPEVVLEEQADVGDDCVSLTFDTRTGTIPTDFSPLCPCDMFRGCFFPLQGLLVLISAGLIGA
jgi:hypothetical protein